MANPRQRRKTRSSNAPVKHSRQAKKLLRKQPPIRGPKVLQEAWDKHKTVRQNYAALGLAHSLTPGDSGGREHSSLPQRSTGSGANAAASGLDSRQVTGGAPARIGDVGNDDARHRDARTGSNAAGKIPRGFGKIVRDASGNVVDVEIGEDEDENGGEDTSLMEVESGARQPERTVSGADWLLQRTAEEEAAGSEVIRALEHLSTTGSSVARTQSAGETRYLAQLVAAYGDDYERMARDRKRNVSQYTAGQLRRAIGKMQAAER